MVRSRALLLQLGGGETAPGSLEVAGVAHLGTYLIVVLWFWSLALTPEGGTLRTRSIAKQIKLPTTAFCRAEARERSSGVCTCAAPMPPSTALLPGV
jgi:hypothetical protein